MKYFGLGTVVVVVGTVVLLTAIVALNGFMLTYMWEWFVVPLGVRGINVPQGIGLAIIFNSVGQSYYKKDKNEDDPIGRMLLMILGRLIAFAIAYGLSFWVIS